MQELRLGARYRVLDEVATGGMGVVHLALRRDDNGLARPVAIKRLHAHLAGDPDMIAMLVDEARIASRIAHSNVVAVHDVEMMGDEDIVVVMEYVEGVSLLALLRAARTEGKTLPIPVIRRVVHDALLGLHAAHGLTDDAGAPLGLVHRDVSPHNLLVGTDGITRVADFGIATVRGRLASTQVDGTVKGKLQYLSPEQIYRKPIDRRADLFAAGIVIWECLTGQKLFAGKSEGETLAAILREPIAPPSSLNPEVPLELDETCLFALERAPERRPETAEALAQLLAAGPMASHQEVGELVWACEPEKLAARRTLLANASSSRQVPSSNDVSAQSLPSEAWAQPTEDARIARGGRGRSLLAVSALLVGSIVGGTLVWIGSPRAAATPTAPTPLAQGTPTPSASASASATIEIDESSAEIDAGASEPAATPPSVTARTSVLKSPTQSAGPKPARGGASRGKADKRPFMPSDL